MVNKLEQFSQLWSSAEQVLRLYLTSVIYNRADADDVLQHVALCAFRKLDTFDDTQPFQAWVFGIARFELLRYFRDHGRRAEVVDTEISERLAANMIDQSEQLRRENQERMEQLEAMLQKLSPKAQELVRLRYFDNLDYADIARRMNTNEGAVRTALSRIIAKLRDFAAAAKEEESPCPKKQVN